MSRILRGQVEWPGLLFKLPPYVMENQNMPLDPRRQHLLFKELRGHCFMQQGILKLRPITSMRGHTSHSALLRPTKVISNCCPLM